MQPKKARERLISVISEIYAERRARNRSYSKRAFAKSSGLSPSFLQEIESGKKTLSSEKAMRFASHLNLSPKKTREIELLAAFTQARSAEVRLGLKTQWKDFEALPEVSALSESVATGCLA